MLGTIWYCYLIIKDRVKPPLATFLIASAVFTISFLMYVQKPDWSFGANIGLVSAVISAWGVLVVLTVKLYRTNSMKAEFTPSQKKMVIASVIILIFWAISKNAFVSYALLQVCALLAYGPVIEKLWGAKKNPESIIFWGSLFLSTCVAAYAAYEKSDLESWIYIARAVPSSLLVLVLLIRLELKYGS